MRARARASVCDFLLIYSVKYSVLLRFPNEAGSAEAAPLSETVLPAQCASAAPAGPLFKLIMSAIGHVVQMIKQEEPRSQRCKIDWLSESLHELFATQS